MEKRLNSGEIHATSQSPMILYYRNPSTVQDESKTTTQISSLQIKTSLSCVRSQAWTLSRSPNTICVNANSGIIPQPIPFIRRINFMEADWNEYSAELDKLIEDVEPIPSNYKWVVEKVSVASRIHIPRGCRTEYVPQLFKQTL